MCLKYILRPKKGLINSKIVFLKFGWSFDIRTPRCMNSEWLITTGCRTILYGPQCCSFICVIDVLISQIQDANKYSCEMSIYGKDSLFMIGFKGSVLSLDVPFGAVPSSDAVLVRKINLFWSGCSYLVSYRNAMNYFQNANKLSI